MKNRSRCQTMCFLQLADGERVGGGRTLWGPRAAARCLLCDPQHCCPTPTRIPPTGSSVPETCRPVLATRTWHWPHFPAPSPLWPPTSFACVPGAPRLVHWDSRLLISPGFLPRKSATRLDTCALRGGVGRHLPHARWLLGMQTLHGGGGLQLQPVKADCPEDMSWAQRGPNIWKAS